MLYNVMDVNVNTAMGEGFGLSLVEGAICGIPVLCPEHSNLIDIWEDNALYIKIQDHDYVAGTKFVGGSISTDSMASKLNKLYEDRNLLTEMGRKALEHASKDKFSWNTIASKVYEVLVSTKDGISYVE